MFTTKLVVMTILLHISTTKLVIIAMYLHIIDNKISTK